MVRALETICIVALGLPACYSPPQPNCGFSCGPGGRCPDDYTCNNDFRCRLNSAPASESCEADAGFQFNDVLILDTPVIDTTPPSLIASVPADGESSVSISTTIVVVFSEPVYNVSTLQFTVFSSGPIVGTIAALGTPPDYSTYEFTPNSSLPPSSTIIVSLTNQIHDGAGNALVTTQPGQIVFSFSTNF